MSDNPNPWLSADVLRGDDYDLRFERLAASGHDVHGEANLVSSFGARAVLDAGCGTGRVAIELSRRGIEVVGVDLDPAMIEAASRKAPGLRWELGDLSRIELDESFDLVIMAGNVMIFVSDGTEGAVVANLARHLRAEGLLVAGFSLTGRLDLHRYDELCQAAGLELWRRWATWDQAPFEPGGDYAISVHRRSKSTRGE